MSSYKEANVYFTQCPAKLNKQNLKPKKEQEAADQIRLVHSMDMRRSVLNSIRNLSSHTTLHVAARNYIIVLYIHYFKFKLF